MNNDDHETNSLLLVRLGSYALYCTYMIYIVGTKGNRIESVRNRALGFVSKPHERHDGGTRLSVNPAHGAPSGVDSMFHPR